MQVLKTDKIYRTQQPLKEKKYIQLDNNVHDMNRRLHGINWRAYQLRNEIETNTE